MPYIGNVTTSSNVNGSQINNGTITGDKLSLPFDYDSATLYLDNTNNRVGILTASPSSTLTVGTGGVVSIPLASAATPSLVFGTDTNTGIYSPGADQLAISTNGTGRLSIDSSGNVGIAATGGEANYTDYGKALVFGSSAETTLGIVLRTGSTGTSSIAFADNSGSGGGAQDGLIEYSQTTRALNFHTAGNSSPRLVIDSSGLLGVGTSSPISPLDVNGQVRAGNLQITDGTYGLDITPRAYGVQLETRGTNQAIDIRSYGTTSASYITLATQNTERLRIDSSGRVGIGNSSPGANLDIYTSASRYVRAFPSSGFADFEVLSNNNSQPVFAIKGTGTADLFRAFANTTQAVTIKSSGNVGIGTSSPTGKLDVNIGTSSSQGIVVQSGNDAAVTGDHILVTSTRGSTSAYNLIKAQNSTGVKFLVSGSGNVGIGTTSPGALLDVSASAPELRISSSNAAQTSGSSIGKLSFYTPDGTTPGGVGVAAFIETLSSTANGSDYQLLISKREGSGGGSNYINLGSSATGAISFGTNTSGSGTERMRIDSSGRLLVGTSSARANLNNVGQTARFQLEGTSNDTNKLLIVSNFSSATNAVGAGLYLARAGSTAVGSNVVVAAGNQLGEVVFSGSDGTDFVQAALIKAEVDGTPGANDMPGRLVFSTTADGAASPTERFRISNDGSFSSVIPGGSTLYPRFGCRAWVNFNGTGTVAIRGSGNVSSITDGGVGLYTVNFTTALVDANYAVTFGSALQNNQTNGDQGWLNLRSNNGGSAIKTTSAVSLWASSKTSALGSAVDLEFCDVAIFR